MYSLSRIKNISVESDKFAFPASADFRVRTDGSYFGAYSTEKKQRFRIAFYNDGAMRVKERLWAKDQKIKETKEGVILSFSSSQYGKVLELVLANGKDALPLAPAELVKDWKENLKGMRERAGEQRGSCRDTEARRG
jgi:predicted DNA-binding transcriptional regulator YafY